MSAQIHVNEDNRFTSMHIEGLVSSEELQTLLDTVLDDHGFQVGWPQLVDLRDASVSSTELEMQQLLESVYNSYRPYIQAAMAVVMDGSLNSEIFARAYMLACNMPETEIFDDYAQALKWLISQTDAAPTALLQHPNTRAQNTH